MKSQVSKHWQGKGYNTPLKQVTPQTSLRDVPEELSNSIERNVDRVGNKIKRGIDRVSNMTLGEAASKTAGFMASGLGVGVGNRVEKAVKGYLDGPSKPVKKNPGKLRKDSKDL